MGRKARFVPGFLGIALLAAPCGAALYPYKAIATGSVASVVAIGERTILETLTSIRRAGASVICTYWAAEAAGWLGR